MMALSVSRHQLLCVYASALEFLVDDIKMYEVHASEIHLSFGPESDAADDCACLLLGIPSRTSREDLMSFFAPYATAIARVTMIIPSYEASRNAMPQQNKCTVVHFKDNESLSSFLNVYNNIHLPGFEYLAPGVLLSVHCNIVSIADAANGLLPKLHHNKCLPQCPVCVRRIKCSYTGLQDAKIPSSLFLNTDSSGCFVCSMINTANDIRCNVCGQRENNWVCILCGNIGCGRYSSQHAKEHFEQSAHSLSLELASHRIWDYNSDCFVHEDETVNSYDRAASSVLEKETMKDGGRRPMADDSVNHVVDEKMSSLSSYYENMLHSQLTDQQLYYEKLLARETVKAFERTHGNEMSNQTQRNEIAAVPNEFLTEDEFSRIESRKLLISALEQQYEGLLCSIRTMEGKVRELKRRNELLMREQKQMKDLIAGLALQEADISSRCLSQVAELERQINDLQFYARSRATLANALRQEDVDGSHLMVTEKSRPHPSQEPKPRQSKKR